MILLHCLIIFACIFTGGAQDRSLDNLIADIFKPDETPSSSTTITPVVNPKDPSSNSGTGTDKGTESGTGSAQYKSCGDQKECVPRWLCANDTINTSGDGIIDIQIGTGSQCENYLDVCCDLPIKDIVDGQG